MTRFSRTARVFGATACAGLLLAGCSVLPKREPVQIWQPQQSATAVATTAPAPDFSLRVDTPNTTGMLNQQGIVVLPEPGQVSTYKGARWSEAPAVLVRSRLVDAFMAAKLAAVTTDDDHYASDYSLGGDLRAFQCEYRAGEPVVVVRYDAQLRRGGSRHLLATRSFTITERPAGTEVSQIVAAFGAADDALAAEVVPWLIDSVKRAPPADADAAPARHAH